MRTLLLCTVSLILVAAGVAGLWREAPVATAAPGSSARTAEGDAGPFVVHEWGTFTSFSGSDGVRLEFRPLVENDLPGFVLDRAAQVGAFVPFLKSQVRVRERMETPVTYFYTERERDIRVRVDFPAGLLTEFYPPVRGMQPKFEPVKPVALRASQLDWGTVHLIPERLLTTGVTNPTSATAVNQRLRASLLPAVTGADHYGLARDTDSAIVHLQLPANPQAPLGPHGDYFEKFLFYRGVGNFELPLVLTAAGQDRFELTNRGTLPVAPLFLVSADGPGQLRFARYDGLLAGQSRTLTLPRATATIDELAESVVASLVAARLYEKEARAMVNTWSSSWFGEPGTRLFYLLPEATTDALLPLHVEPRPDETVRVMVGRLEIMAPETEARLTELVRRSAADRAVAFAERKEREASLSEEEKAKPAYKMPEAIHALGRLAEPALARVKHLTREPAVRDEATALLAELHAKR